ncbi:hypothetical protein K402DRAFT_237050 [Aulographum hederae CBS 113979]|uniref:Uncharacterized protein n=1 Tax=Aulographum hederae CBS 113979 TaxID=1176131 RepID=A0A6G1GKE0_9PEZI|nr:hypothetical protein K402DRAFT_237050 [Aulographum hederae CBS 113979]
MLLSTPKIWSRSLGRRCGSSVEVDSLFQSCQYAYQDLCFFSFVRYNMFHVSVLSGIANTKIPTSSAFVQATSPSAQEPRGNNTTWATLRLYLQATRCSNHVRQRLIVLLVCSRENVTSPLIVGLSWTKPCPSLFSVVRIRPSQTLAVCRQLQHRTSGVRTSL